MMKLSTAPEQYIIQIDLNADALSSPRKRSRAPVDVKRLQSLLAGTGIELDENYRPVLINPQQQRFVVRGHGTPAAKQRAERLLGQGVKFFADGRVQTTNTPTKMR